MTVDRKDSLSGLAAHSTCSALNQVEKLLAPPYILLSPLKCVRVRTHTHALLESHDIHLLCHWLQLFIEAHQQVCVPSRPSVLSVLLICPLTYLSVVCFHAHSLLPSVSIDLGG